MKKTTLSQLLLSLSLVMSVPSFAQSDPAWIRRGSGAFNQNRRVFYGVSAASDIKNLALLRQTADNRACHEVGKIFTLFTASMAQDYLASAAHGDQSEEAQSVAQLNVTWSGVAQQGAEVVDRHISKEGVQYSLCQLDFDRVDAIVRAGHSLKNKFSDFISQKDVKKLFDQFVKSQGKPHLNELEAAPSQMAGSTSVKSLSVNADAQKLTARPLWLEREDPRYPWRNYIYAVGYGSDRTAAENGAIGALSKIFEVRVMQVASDFQASYIRSNTQDIELQSSDVLTRTTTEKVIAGARVAEVYEDQKSKTTYAIAVMNRAQAAARLREQIAPLDQEAQKILQDLQSIESQTIDKVARARAFKRAASMIQQREALNSDLRIINPDGIGVVAAFSIEDVFARATAAQEEMTIGVYVKGARADDIRSHVVQQLAARGFRMRELKNATQTESESSDVAIIAEVRIERLGRIQYGQFEMVRAVMNVAIRRVAMNKIIDGFSVSAKEGHPDASEASARAARSLGKVAAEKIAEALQKYIDTRP